MTHTADEEARARRAEARRQTWGAIERVPSGADKPPLHDALTMEERLVRLWQLTVRAWTFAGRPIARVLRSDWPTEVFEIEHGRRGTAGRLP